MFQFQCPQCAQILQADPQQVGQPSQCPLCQALFVIPVPVRPAVQDAPASPPRSAELPMVQASPRRPLGRRRRGHNTGATHPPSQPQVDAGLGPVESAHQTQPAKTAFPQEPELFHIPCPKCKQVLETPPELLDQDVLCPQCETQFRLLQRNSQEARRKREREQKLREQRASKLWFNWAVIAVVCLVLFLLFLMLAAGS